MYRVLVMGVALLSAACAQRPEGEVPVAAPASASPSPSASPSEEGSLALSAKTEGRAFEATNQDEFEWTDCNVQLDDEIPEPEPWEHPIVDRIQPGQTVVLPFADFHPTGHPMEGNLDESGFDPLDGSQLILSCETPRGFRHGLVEFGDLREEPPSGPGVVVGEPYEFDLYTHCGILGTRFDGREWVADPPVDDGQGNPPPGWGNPSDAGTMTLIEEDLAVFESSSGEEAFPPATSHGSRDPTLRLMRVSIRRAAWDVYAKTRASRRSSSHSRSAAAGIGLAR